MQRSKVNIELICLETDVPQHALTEMTDDCVGMSFAEGFELN